MRPLVPPPNVSILHHQCGGVLAAHRGLEHEEDEECCSSATVSGAKWLKNVHAGNNNIIINLCTSISVVVLLPCCFARESIRPLYSNWPGN